MVNGECVCESLTKMAEYLPVEIMTNILSRLTVETLLRLRSTSKSFRSLIDSHHFSSLHLSRSLTPNSSNLFLILRHHSLLYTSSFPSLPKPHPLHQPLMSYNNRISLLGSSNGLLAISNVADDIAIWNPSTRHYHLLPYISSDSRPGDDSTLCAARIYGFGPISADYKLVRITYLVNLHNRTFDTRVRIFSLRSNSWKAIPSMPYALCCARTMGVFVAGSLHWVVTRKLEPGQPDLIVAFDLESETFSEVPLPEEVACGDGDLEIEIALLGQCLCMAVNYQKVRVDVWVMREYCCEGSWWKVFTLLESRLNRPLRSVKPLGYSSDGCEVLLEFNRGRLCWYNLKNQEVSFVNIPGMQGLSEGMICVGSLLPPSIVVRENCRKQRKLGCQSSTKTRDDFLSQGFKLTL